jgi:phosphoserine phosphatase RsbU/P
VKNHLRRGTARMLELMRFLALATIVCGLMAGAPAARAQVFDASDIQKPVQVDAPWRAHVGDDPAWAQPDFDDSNWMLIDPYKHLLEYFPEDHTTVIWYRIRVKVASHQTGLALQENHLSRAFEVYVNGERVMGSGSVSPYHPYTFYASPVRTFSWRDMQGGTLVIALRVHISRGEWAETFPGLNYDNLMIGRRPQLLDYLWLRWIGTFAGPGLCAFLGLIVGLMALGLYSVQRDRIEYLWMPLVALGFLLEFAWQVLLRAQNLPLKWAASVDGILMLWVLLSPIFMYAAFLKLNIGRRTTAVLAAASTLSLLVVVGGDYDWMQPAARLALSLPLQLIAYVAVPIVLFRHWRRGNREAGILLIPAVLHAVVTDFLIFMGALEWVPKLSTWAFRVSESWTTRQAGPFTLQLANAGNALFWISLGLILVLRTIRISREQARMEGDLEAAREVQQVILPRDMDVVPGFSVETVYRPAQQVGGDFFQVWPAPDGGLLLVLGDVAGKGLPAAMQVAVLVGSMRTLAGRTSDPGQILAEMNDRLIGKTTGGFSTCLAVLLRADGSGLLASAGHPAPYLNGRELEMPGALPLGIVPDQTYDLHPLQLEPGSRLTFYSDGVLEAQNPQGELLGFERVGKLAGLGAKEIADYACAFGQEDDITVVVIERGRGQGDDGAKAARETLSANIVIAG